MPDNTIVELARLGPFRGLNTRTAMPYMDPKDGVVTDNADTRTYGSGLIPFTGRTPYVDFNSLGGADAAVLAYYIAGQNIPYLIAQNTNGRTAYYDPTTQTQHKLLVNVALPFTQSVQSNGMLFLNSGQQIFLGNDGLLHLARWQYPAPTEMRFGYNAVAQAGGTLAKATYYYAFTNVITLPTAAGDVTQETSPQARLFSVSASSNGSDSINVSASGAGFSGTTSDGYAFTTNIYRLSTNVPVWFQLAAGVTGTSYIDDATDQSISGNPQLIQNQDDPPLPGSAGFADSPNGFIEELNNRMWVLTTVQDAATNNQPQTQLWYTHLGQPWSFDDVLQVLLVGNEETTITQVQNIPVPYGDQPTGLCRIGSYLMVFKSHSTWIVTGTDQTNFTALPLFQDVGCIAPLSITKCNGLVIWLSAQGVYAYDGGTLTYASDEVYNTLQNADPQALAAAVGFYADLTYFLSIPDLGTLAFYVPSKTWSLLDDATPFAVFDTSIPADPFDLGSGGNAGTITKYNQVLAIVPGTQEVDAWFTSTATAEAVIWEGPVTDSSAPFVEKNYQRVSLTAPPMNPATAWACQVTTTVDPQSNPNVRETVLNFDLTKGGTQIQPIPQENSNGYTAQMKITLTPPVLAPGVIGELPQIWSVVLGGTPNRYWTMPS